MKPSRAANDFHVDRTRQVWQPRLGRALTDEDARQITHNVTGFFAVLAEWSRVETRVPANETGKPSICPGHDDRDGDGG
jgi:hypothetical protein